MDSADAIWPDLSYSAWSETLATLHLWTQIVGKIRLSLTPWLNHSWQTPLYVTARGLGTSPIPIGTEIFEIEFDFVGHRLKVRTSRGGERALPLKAQAVADFFFATIDLLADVGVAVVIKERRSQSCFSDRRLPSFWLGFSIWGPALDWRSARRAVRCWAPRPRKRRCDERTCRGWLRSSHSAAS
jgi:hypothetical protein